MTIHEQYMSRCLELARLGAGSVAPNPMVGSVLVHENRILGEGYHQLYGQSHAEVNCLRDAAVRYPRNPLAASLPFEDILQKSTLYVSLEPCAHYGKTPPCANLIIENRIPRVVVGCRDPFPLVDGKGIEKLLAAGIEVTTGILEQACMALNNRFFTYHLKKRPYVILKWARSVDGKMAASGAERTLISGAFSNRLVHRWRSEEPAILVGTRTALLDDPSLTVRLWMGKDPLRLVVDKNLQLPGSLRMLQDGGRTVVFNYLKEEQGNVTHYRLPGAGSLAQEVLAALYSMNIQSVLVEGGAALLQGFIEENCWDEARVIINTGLEIGPGLQAPLAPAEALAEKQKYGEDEIRFYRR